MRWAEISIQTSHEATEAVANIFHELGASGVVIEDPEMINSYRRSGTWDYCDLPEPEDVETVTIKAYLPVDELLDDKLRLFESQVNDLITHDLDAGKKDIQWREVQDEDWETSWKDYFHTIKAGEKIVIKPSWENYEALPDDLVIELDPGMAFGTGTHHTTTLCIRCLEEIIQQGDAVFDIGTGSGILAIAAARLGAGKVSAVDIDSVAVKVAKENVGLNNMEQIVSVNQGDLFHGVSGQADIIVANIIANIIIEIMPEIPSRLKPEGYFLASGIIVERLSDVTAAVLAQGLTVDRVIEEGGWVAMVIRKGDA